MDPSLPLPGQQAFTWVDIISQPKFCFNSEIFKLGTSEISTPVIQRQNFLHIQYSPMILEHGANLIYLYFYTLSKIRGQMCISANIRLEAKHPRVRKEGSLKLLKHQEGGEQSHIGHSLSQHLFDLKFCFIEILIVLCVCV